MMKNKKDYEDDGRVIADMSDLDRPSISNLFRKNREVQTEEEPVQYTKEQTLWAILGALKAALLVGFAYIFGLGSVILLMYLFFKKITGQ